MTTMTERHTLESMALPGTRNLVRVGDIVKVLPSAPRKRDGFRGKVFRIDADADGNPVSVEVGPDAHGAVRSIYVDRIARLAQPAAQAAYDEAAEARASLRGALRPPKKLRL